MNKKTRDYYREVVERELPAFIQILESCLDFDKWGFKRSFYGLAPELSPCVIYDSDSCRVKFCWAPGDMRDESYMHVWYGRLHASDDELFILWNGYPSHCWHAINKILNFLDGLSPQEAVEKRNKRPVVMEQFIQANKGDNWSEVEWTARLHAAVWEHYGNRLFDLLDLHHSELWDQYTSFTRNFYELNPGVNLNEPLPERIC